MGFISDHFRPNRAERHRENVAQEHRALLIYKAELARIAALQHKENGITKIKAAIASFKSEIDAWYQAELSVAMQRYVEEQQDYQNLLQSVNDAQTVNQQELKALFRESIKDPSYDLLQCLDYSNDANFLVHCQQIISKIKDNAEPISLAPLERQNLATITREFEQKLTIVEEMYAEILQQIESKWLEYQNIYTDHITKLTASRDEQLKTIDTYELQEIAKVEAAYKEQLKSINEQLRKGLEEIDNSLLAQLKQLKHVARAFVITALTVVVAAAAAYFSAGMLAGMSAYLIDMLQSALAVTSLRATERLINGSDSIGVDVSINVAPQPTASKFTPAVIHDKELPADITVDYQSLQRRFEEFGQNLHIDAKNDVFHQGSNMQSNNPLNINPITQAENLEQGVSKSLLIGSGRLFVETGQGIKELSLQCGEKLGIVEPERVANYSSAIKKEHALYQGTPVANSTAGRVGELATGALVYSFVPVGAGLRGYRLAAAGAASGGFISGIQPVYDGTWESRGKNVAIGAGTGAVVAPALGMWSGAASKGILKLYDIRGISKSFQTKGYSSLDWSTASSRTKSSAAHHVILNHGKINLQKPKQDVFYSDPIAISEKAWFHIQKKGSKPVQYNGTDIHIIHRGSVGFSSGMSGQRQNLDYVTIITQSKTNKIITCFPSGRTPPLPKDYVFSFKKYKAPKP